MPLWLKGKWKYITEKLALVSNASEVAELYLTKQTFPIITINLFSIHPELLNLFIILKEVNKNIWFWEPMR